MNPVDQAVRLAQRGHRAREALEERLQLRESATVGVATCRFEPGVSRDIRR
jgi:hypothetical protein